MILSGCFTVVQVYLGSNVSEPGRCLTLQDPLLVTVNMASSLHKTVLHLLTDQPFLPLANFTLLVIWRRVTRSFFQAHHYLYSRSRCSILLTSALINIYQQPKVPVHNLLCCDPRWLVRLPSHNTQCPWTNLTYRARALFIKELNVIKSVIVELICPLLDICNGIPVVSDIYLSVCLALVR